MKLFPWLNCITADITGTKQELGQNYEKLDKLYDAGWRIDTVEQSHLLDDTDAYFYDAEGLLLPEEHGIAVYLKLKADKRSMRPQHTAVKIGYLDKGSKLARRITHATMAKIHCKDVCFNSTMAKRFHAYVIGAPPKLTTDEYCKYAIDVNLD
ncbi:MAG: hypothetical protein H9W80_10600 [Enterococcus sp.]|nr:hypothetical protein [Enterococcus sp.]